MSNVTTKVQLLQQHHHHHHEIGEINAGIGVGGIFSTNLKRKVADRYEMSKNDLKRKQHNDESAATTAVDDKSTADTEADADSKPYKMEIVWFNAIGFLIIHLAALYGFYLMCFKAKLLTVIWVIAVGYLSALATTMGAHRLYTHRTYKANKWIRLALVTCQTIAGQNCLWVWIRDHRQHHKYSDTHGDPHNASRGFFFSHIGWLMVRKHPEVFVKGKTIDMSDINADPMVMFQKKYYKTLFIIFAITIPTVIPCLLWNETLYNSFFASFVARLIFSLNLTWLVNSAAHLYGMKPFSKDIYPAENWLISMFGLGEGWHNYHHTFPWDYRAAEFGQHFNLTTNVIDYCARKGWVYDLKSASSELVKNQALKKGDGSHYQYNKLINSNSRPFVEKRNFL